MDNIYKNNIVYLQEIILLSICLLQGVDIQSVMNWTKNEVIEPKKMVQKNGLVVDLIRYFKGIHSQNRPQPTADF